MLASTAIHSNLPFGCHKRWKSHTQQNIENFAAKIIYRRIGKKMMVEVELHLCDAFVGWKKKSKFIDPNDTLQNHKLASIWILRTIIRHIDKSALILNGNSIPHRRIWEFLNDDDDERNISNQPWNRFHRNHWKWWLQKELNRTWFRGNANRMRGAESGPFRPKGSNRH